MISREFEKAALETAGAINDNVEKARQARAAREAAEVERKAREKAEHDAAVARLEEASKPVFELLESMQRVDSRVGFSHHPDVKHNRMFFNVSTNPDRRFDTLNESAYSLEIIFSPDKKKPFYANGLVSTCRDPNEKISLATRFCRLVASIDPWGPHVTVKSADIGPIAAMAGRWMGSLLPNTFKRDAIQPKP